MHGFLFLKRISFFFHYDSLEGSCFLRENFQERTPFS
jgi:hypothetical protein